MSAAGRVPRWLWIVAGLALVVVTLGYFGVRAGVRAVQREVEAALGPGAQIGSIRADSTAVEIEGLVIPGGDGWPVAESLRAERVRIAPSWRALLAGRIEVARIDIERPYLSMLRSRDGRLRMVPTLLEANAEKKTPASGPEAGELTSRPGIAIGTIRIRGGTLELYDATVARKPWRVRLTEMNSRLDDIVAPALDRRMPFELEAAVDGPQRDGRVALSGWVVAATRDLELRGDLTGIDLLALEPYLLEATKARLDRGTLDLGIEAKVESKQLHAPGHLVLSNLEFARGGKATAQVMGVPRDLLIAALQAKGGRIALDFSLDGRIDDPRFSLNETLSTRIGIALAKELGVSVGGLVEGTLGLGLDGVQEAGKAAGGVGSALRKLLPGR